MLSHIAKSVRPVINTWVAIPFPLRQARLSPLVRACAASYSTSMAAADSSLLPKAVVKALPDESNLTISLTVGGKQRNLERPKDELLDKPLTRLQKLAAGKPDKKQKRAAQSTTADAHSPSVAITALYDGPTTEHPILDPSSTTNSDAWTNGRLLLIGDTAYIIELNPPSGDDLHIHGAPFVGIPLVPRPSLHFATGAEWQWYKKKPHVKGEVWQAIPGAIHRAYTPVADDYGYSLQVECRPTRDDVVGEAIYTHTSAVRQQPSPESGAGRHEYTKQPTTSPTVRIVSYNILADQYASTDTAKNVLFPYCPPECLEPAHRRPLILGELLGYNADIICLQEVDDKAFNLHLQPCLEEQGYDGVYTNKAGQVREGSAAFWRRDRFKMVAQKDVPLKSLFPASIDSIDSAEYGPAFAPMLQSSPSLTHALQRVGTVAQLVLLQPIHSNEEERPICLANTHLFFHYAAPHIRTIHTWAILQQAHQFISNYTTSISTRNDDKQPALVFCGDFNSDLNDGIPGAIDLLHKGVVTQDHWDWAFGVAFKWEKGQEDADDAVADGGSTDAEVVELLKTEAKEDVPIHGMELSSPFTGGLASADGFKSEFTNYVKGYQGLLDYIWYQPEAMKLVQWVPLPTRAELGGFLPSRNYPSDHLAIIADLQFCSSSGSNDDDAMNTDDDNEDTSILHSNEVVKEAMLYNVGVAADALDRGDMIAVPTDTIYGLAASAASPQGVERIYQTKNRAGSKPLAICVADLEDVPRYADVDHIVNASSLLADLLPGPVTLLLKRKESSPLAKELNPGVDLIGIRIPDHQFLRAVCRQHRGALALTSANISGAQSTVEVEEFEPLWDKCAAVFNGGQLPAGRSGSTIIDLTVSGQFRIVRRGNGFLNSVQLLTTKYGLKHIIDTD